MNPQTAQAGGPAFTLTVSGTNFNCSSIIQVNGNPSSTGTTFNSATSLSTVIQATQIANPVSLDITVANPSPGAGVLLSNSATLMVTAPPQEPPNPVPSASSISPTSVAAGGAASP